MARIPSSHEGQTLLRWQLPPCCWALPLALHNPVQVSGIHAEGGSAADAMALAAARAFIGGGDQAAQFAQTIQRAIQLFNCSDGLQATLAGTPPKAAG